LLSHHFHLFGAPKDAICVKRFVSDDEVVEEVTASTNSAWYKMGIDDLVSHWCKAVFDYVRK
jgi:hypothetical protein